jgi:hypothetical protein
MGRDGRRGGPRSMLQGPGGQRAMKAAHTERRADSSTLLAAIQYSINAFVYTFIPASEAPKSQILHHESQIDF